MSRVFLRLFAGLLLPVLGWAGAPQADAAVDLDEASQATAPAAPGPGGRTPAPRPAVLTPGGKFKRAVHHSVTPMAFVTSFAAAGYSQAMNTRTGFGQGAEGYFKRAGASWANSTSRNMIGSFALASLFHQDPRYFPSRRPGFMRRLVYAGSRAVICRGDNGRSQFNISRVGGSFAAGALSVTWHEPPDDTIARGLRRGAVSLGTAAIRDIWREFWPDIRRKLGR